MAPWSGVQILGRDSNGPIVTCMLNSLNSLPLDIDASLDVAGKKNQRIFRMCMETMTKLFVWFSFLLKNQLIMALWSARVSDVREGYNWSESERACIYLIRYLLLEKWVHSILASSLAKGF